MFGRLILPLLSLSIAMAGCAQGPNATGIPGASAVGTGGAFSIHRGGNRAFGFPQSAKIQHVVVIVQENRPVDYLFNGFPGANTVRFGRNSYGQIVPLHKVRLTARYDISHKHDAFINEYDHGKLDGFNKVTIICRRHCPDRSTAAYGYVNSKEVAPYWKMAKQYVLADNMFQTNQGPSFPAHQYLISGTSTIATGSSLRAAENPRNTQDDPNEGGCDSATSARVAVIDTYGVELPGPFPCFVRLSIMDLLDGAGVTWKYYQAYGGAGLWNAVDAIKQIWQKPEYKTNVIWPSGQFLKDISSGKLAAVTFITPTAKASDHAGKNNGTGPSWVAAVVNAIGKSPYWGSTAIFVTWDDWGGWYDHVAPPQYKFIRAGLAGTPDRDFTLCEARAHLQTAA